MRIGLVILLSCLTASSAIAADTTPPKPAFKVVLAVDPRLPSMSQKDVEQALKLAANWIEVWYRKRVRFQVDRTEHIDSYMSAVFEKLPIPGDWLKYPYALDGSDQVARFHGQQVAALKERSLDAIRGYVPDDIKPLITSPELAAANLLKIYDDRLKIWRTIRSPKGLPYFDTGFPAKHSYWHWERLFDSYWPEDITDHIIVTNVMLIDDALGDAPPHSLVRGGLLNGLAQEESPQVVVSTFPLITDAPAVSDLRDTTALSSRDRIRALAHIIAHEFGAHVIQGYFDVYDHTACVAVPTPGLAYAATLRNLFSGPPCKLAHPPLDRKKSLTDRYENLAHRYLAVKDYANAKKAVDRAISLEPGRPLLKMMRRQLSKKLQGRDH
ncbi:hypothetical protein HY522_11925 [bacterium]|nr:hypothetical protein [bacterium]